MAGYFIDSSPWSSDTFRKMGRVGCGASRGAHRQPDLPSAHYDRRNHLCRRPPPEGQNSHVREGSSILYRFRQHLAGRYTIIEITPALLNDATRLANHTRCATMMPYNWPLSLQIHQQREQAGSGRSALVSADRDLNNAAIAEGLAVENPNLHP